MDELGRGTVGPAPVVYASCALRCVYLRMATEILVLSRSQKRCEVGAACVNDWMNVLTTGQEN